MNNIDYPLNNVDEVYHMKELLKSCVKKHHSKIAFEYKNNSGHIKKTYKDFYVDVKKVSTALINRRFKNIKMAVIGENSYEWILTYFGVINSSNTIIPLDKELAVDAIIGLLKKSGSKVFFYTKKYSKYIIRIKSELRDIILVNLSENNEQDLNIYKLLQEGETLIESGNTSYDNNSVEPNQLAAIHFTSGTTGVSKGVMLSHQNILSSAIGAARNVDVLERSVLVLPLNHTYGLTAAVISPLLIGKTVFINQSMKKISSDLKEQNPDHLFLVPLFVEAMYKKIWTAAEKAGKDKKLKYCIKLSNALLRIGVDLRKKMFKSVIDAFGGELKLIVCGGAPLNPKYVKGFREFGINVLNGYGITECSPIVSVNRNKYYKDGSVGPVLDCCEVKIDKPNQIGEGEILVRGKNVMLGYYKDNKVTQKVIENGWFRTGDIGKIDKDGFLYITGRKKNLIIPQNGKNIHPEELEMHILNIPYVKEVLVYSENESRKKDIKIVAEVYLDNEMIIDNDPMKWLKQDIDRINKTIPHYKNINKIKIRNTEFEKTTTQKIKRFSFG